MGDKVYSVANITSISTQEIPRPGAGCPVALIAAGCVLGFAIRGCGLHALLILGGVPLAFGILWLVGAMGTPPQCVVRIASASAEQEALRRADREFVERVAAAIKQAIRLRG
jgi:hypothetical protein